MGLVFQYGSNALSGRLNSPNRLNNKAKLSGKARTVENYDIVFDVNSVRNKCAASNLVRTTEDRRAWGVLYEVPDGLIKGKNKPEGKTLEEIDGDNYECKVIKVERDDGTKVDAATYLVKQGRQQPNLATSVWYVSWIVYGLREHDVPEEWVKHVVDVAIRTNSQATQNANVQNQLIQTL